MPAYLDDYLGTIAPRRQRRRPQSGSLPFDLTPEQTTSLIGRAGGGLVSGLSAGANVLDLPGSMVRDVIGGVQTGDWSRHNPLDQLIDPFGRQAEDNRVTGRDLLRYAGVIGKKDTWGNFAGGLVAEGLTDPFTYLTFGASALTKGGKAAKAAGALPEGLAGQIAGGHRGLAGLRLPFGEYVLPIGTGKASQFVAGGIDKAAEAARYGDIPGTSFSPGRLTARLFDSALGDTRTTPVQKLAKGLAGKRSAEIAAGRLFSAAKARELIDSGLVTPENGDALRRALEGTGRVGDFDHGKMGDVNKFVNETTAENQQLLQRAKAAGMDVEAFQDSTNLRYFQRYLSAEGSTTKWKGKVLDTTDKSQIGREWYMRDIEGGTDLIQRVARDPDIEALIAGGTRPAAIRDAITAKYGDVFKGNAEKTAKEHGTRFVESLMGMKPETRAAGVFGNHPVADMLHGMTSRRDAITVSEGINEFLQQPGMTRNVIGPDTVPADELLKSMKLSGSPLVGQGLHVPAEIAADLKRLHQGFTTPDSVNELIQAFDSSTNLWKALQTGVWPAFHARNRVSGLWQNYIAGMFDLRSEAAAGAIMQGKVVKDAHLIPAVAAELTRRGMTVDAANGTKVLADLAFSHEVIGKWQGEAANVTGKAAMPGMTTLDDITSAIPGIVPTRRMAGAALDIPTFIGARKGTSRKPWRVRGVGDRTASEFGPAKWGENLGHVVEGQNRLSPFINQLRKGVDPATAAQKVSAAQVNYHNKNFTPFESQFLARLLPFYKFCVSEDTEALTREGWKHHSEINVGDDILSLNPVTDEYEWVPVEAINVFPHAGELIKWKTSRKHKEVAFLFTDEHQWLIDDTGCVENHTRYESRVETSLWGEAITKTVRRRAFVRGSDLKPHHRIVTKGQFYGTESCLSPRHAAILGWIVTDGTIRKRGNSWEAVVYQHPKKYLNEVISLLGTKTRKPHPETGTIAVPVAREDVREITTLFSSKRDLPGIVGRLSREAADAMKSAMLLAEGTEYEDGRRVFYQSYDVNPDVADAFQMLCALTGDCANLTPTCCTLRKSSHYWVNKALSRETYVGKVWCPTTKHGTWVARRNGCMVITGNSSKMLPYQLRMLADQPGGKLAQTLRGINRARDPNEMTPDYVAETASIPLGQRPDGSNRYLTGFGLPIEDTLSLITPDIRSSGLEVLSRTNPWVKAPLEYMTGQTFFQKGPAGGRPLEDLDPTVGRTIANIKQQLGGEETRFAKPVLGSDALEFVLANSPLSRLLTSTRTATDPRKGTLGKVMNLGTGFKVSDVSPAAQDALLQERADAALKRMGARDFDVVYLPEDVKATLSPEQQVAYLQLMALKKEQAKRKKKRVAETK